MSKINNLNNCMSLSNRAGWTTDEWDHRDPIDDLHDVETGKYLSAMQELPQSVRQLMQESDFFVVIDESNRVTKEIHKRDPEFQTGNYVYRVKTEDGEKLLDEEALDKLLGLEGSPDDVYANPDNLEYGHVSMSAEESDDNMSDGNTVVECDYVAPMDRWDLIYDDSEYRKAAIEYTHSSAYARHSERTRQWVFSKLYDENVYSADMFLKKQDKRLKTQLTKDMAKCIQEGSVQGKDLVQWTKDKTDPKVPEINKLTWMLYSGRCVCYGKRRVNVWKRRQELIEKRINAMKKMKTFKFNDNGDIEHIPSVNAVQNLSSSDKQKLWDLWRKEQVLNEGEIKATSWVYAKIVSKKFMLKVNSGVLSKEEADKKFAELMKKLYGKTVKGLVIEPVYSNKLITL